MNISGMYHKYGGEIFMQIFIPTDNGFLDPKYTKLANDSEKYKGYPNLSFPVKVLNQPREAKSLAFTFLDYDAIPVRGFTMIHWIGANLASTINCIPENASQSDSVNMVQGSNSTAGSFINVTDPKINQHYFGPCPPDKDHKYLFTLYAVDSMLPLKSGYYLNEFYELVKGHILESCQYIVKAKK